MYAVNWDLVDTLGISRTAFAGEAALVTGGARGIGEGAAVSMAALGAQVVIVDKRPIPQGVADAINARAPFLKIKHLLPGILERPHGASST
jgi:NAD(P)-dependent dehydrogenase (short-subunit alcohol dehydrogenase family)